VLPRPAALVLLAAPLAACGGSAEQPTTLPSRDLASTPDTSAAPTPTASGPAAAVEAAVRTYYATLTKAAQRNDSSLLDGLVDAGCPCAAATQVIADNASRGQTTPDAAFVVQSVRPHDVEGSVAIAEVTYQASVYDVQETGGQVVSRVDAHRSHLDLSLVKSDEG